MNNSNLVIHIGPPKTATTSLQYLLQEIKIENFIYGGAMQPRSNSDRSIGPTICRDIMYNCINNTPYKYKENIQLEIQKKLNKNNTFFLSDECFLVEGLIAWKQKLRCLYEYIGIFNPIVLLTIRKPEKVLVSYYIEMYKTLRRNYRKNFRLFFESEYCTIYKYEKLISYLNELNFERIKIIDFDKLVHGNYFCSDLMICSKNNDQNLNLTFQKMNVTIPASNGRHCARGITVKNSILSILRYLPVFQRLRGRGGIWRKIFLNLPDLNLRSKILNMDFQDFNYTPFVKEYESVLKTIDKL